MAQWSKESPPNWAPDAVATPAGWVDDNTGEILVAVRNLAVKANEANIVEIDNVADIEAAYVTGENIDIVVQFNEKVTVTGSPQLPITIGGVSAVADYQSGTGKGKIKFRYTVQGGDSGALVLVSPIGLNSGTILDKAAPNSAASLTFTPPSVTSTVN